MSNERDRVISITLTESEWQAFVARQPQPVNWLRDRIRDEVATPTEQQTKSAPQAPPPPPRLAGHHQLEDCTPGPALHGYPSAVAFDNRLHDREPQAAAS